MSEIEIDNSNFKDYFFDARKHKPQAGQILAKFSAYAIFGDGPEKTDLIKVLKMGKPEAAAAVMKKIHCAAEPDNLRVCREMCEDLIKGMTEEEVRKKDYEFLLEAFYYTQREYVPRDDKHWTTIELIDASSVTIDPETGEIKCKIEIGNEEMTHK